MAVRGYRVQEEEGIREAGGQSSSARVSDKQHQEDSQCHLKVGQPLPWLRRDRIPPQQESPAACCTPARTER